MLIVFALVIFIGLSAFIWYVIEASNKSETKMEEEMRKRQQLEDQKKQQEEFAQKDALRNEAFGGLVQKYGLPDRIITIKQHDINQEIIVFEKSGVVWLAGQEVQIASLLEFSLEDVPVTVGENTTITSSANTGDAIRRAAVGSIFGEAGAIVGGMTAQRDYSVTHHAGTTLHNYYLVVLVDDLNAPQIIVDFGRNAEAASDTVGVLKLVMHHWQIQTKR